MQGKVAAQAGDLAEARALFMEATAAEADCVEAIYNLGLVSKGLGNLEDALTAFKKLNSILTDDAAAMHQVVLHNLVAMFSLHQRQLLQQRPVPQDVCAGQGLEWPLQRDKTLLL